jgi:hypothetical protein
MLKSEEDVSERVPVLVQTCDLSPAFLETLADFTFTLGILQDPSSETYKKAMEMCEKV